MHPRPLSTLLLLTAGLPAADLLTVTAPRIDPLPATATGDAAAGLRLLPGVGAIRMGGVGLDPVVRGQSGTRLLVITDGACPHGGCPNRMDPPTTYAPTGADAWSLEPGGLSVRHPGAPLGVIALDRRPLEFSEDQNVAAEAEGRYDGNGRRRLGRLRLAVGGPDLHAEGRFELARGADYADGDGNEVRSGYRRQLGGGTVAWAAADATRIEVSYDATREREVLYAGAGMDAPISDGDTARLRLRYGADDTPAITADVWVSQVTHLMNNYSLRPQSGMHLRVPTSSDSAGARAMVELDTTLGRFGLGADVELREQDARRYSGPDPSAVTALNSVMWPDIRQRRIGAWTDLQLPVGSWRLIPGLRADLVASQARDAAVDPPGMPLSPAQLYSLYYAADADDRRETLWGAALRAERDLGADILLTLAFSRQQRAADPTERFLAANGMSAAQRWVGNPSLAAETHWQAQATVERSADDSPAWRIEAWADRIADYIRRDRARGQDGVLPADGATVYHNGEALLLGVVARGELPLATWLRLRGDASWTRGEDLDTGLPLPQIPPLTGALTAAAAHDAFDAALALRWSARATRVDDDPGTGSALDAGPTPAWAVLDLRLRWRPCASAELAIGCDNLLDRAYAEHLNKPSAFDTNVTRVNEPGRSLWAAATVRF